MLAGPVPTDAIASMRLSALVVDLAVLGPQAWEWLERLCGALPELGVVVCTGPSTVAQRVRGLRLGADDWITKPCHPEEVIARVQGVARRRRRVSGRTEVKPLLAGEVEIRTDRFQAFVAGQQPRPDPARVRADRAARRRRGAGARARGDLLAAVGLRDGARRPLGRRVRAQAPPEAREAPRRAGATSTPTSASATASRRSRSTRSPPARASSRTATSMPRAATAASIPVDWDAGDQRELAGTHQDASSPPAPSSRTTARPPFFRSIRPPVSPPDQSATGRARGRPAAGARPAPGRSASASSACAASKPPASGGCSRSSSRCCALQPSAASCAVVAGAHLRAEQHRVERHRQPLDRDPRRARLLLPARGQPALRVRRVPCGSASA